MPNTPTVFVVDDDQAVRTSLELLMRSVGHRVETFQSAQEFLDSGAATRRGCLILDIRMAGMSGLELQHRLKETGSLLPVIVITGHGDVPIAVRAMKDGAMEFLEKPFSKQLLLEHVREALRLDEARRAADSNRSTSEARLATLTPRERQVMDLVVAGKASKEIALVLGISKKTVDVHRARVMQKLEAGSIPQLVEIALTARTPNAQSSGDGAASPRVPMSLASAGLG